MYSIKKSFMISAAHSLSHLPYRSPCKRMHGHNWNITVYCKGEMLNDNGMIIDFAVLKKLIHNKLDHKCLNRLKIGVTTAEAMAAWVCRTINDKFREPSHAIYCYKVDIEETEGSVATYEI